MENQSQRADSLFEQELQVLYQGSPNGIIIFREDNNGTFWCSSCNPVFRKIFHIEENQVVGKQPGDLLQGDEFSQLNQAIFNLQEYEDAYPVFVDFNDHRYKVFSTILRTSDEGRSILLSFTERWRYSPTFYGNPVLLEAIQDAIFIFDVAEDGSYYLNYLNQSHMRTTGLNIATDLGKTPIELIGEDEGRQVVARYDQCVHTQKALMYEEKLTFPDDIAPRWWQTRLSPLIIDGQVKQIIGASRDITAFKQALNQFEGLYGEFEALFNELNYPIWQVSVDEEGKFYILRFNRYFEGLYNLNALDYRGKEFTELFKEPYASQILENYQQVIQTKAIMIFENESEFSGKSFRVLSTLIPVIEDDRVVSIFGTSKEINDASSNVDGQYPLRDIMFAAQAKRQEQVIRETIIAQDEIYTSLTNQFREPLTSILGLTEIVMKITPQSDLRFHYLHQMQDQSFDLLKKVDENITIHQDQDSSSLRGQAFDFGELVERLTKQALLNQDSSQEKFIFKNNLPFNMVWQDGRRVAKILDKILSFICRHTIAEEKMLLTASYLAPAKAIQLSGTLEISSTRFTEDNKEQFLKSLDEGHKRLWEQDEDMVLAMILINKIGASLDYDRKDDCIQLILSIPLWDETASLSLG